MIQGQITTTNIKQDKTITGINIPNQKERIKISQYAGDFNFFLKNQESVKKVLTFFENLNKATGAIINLEKTTVLPLDTDNTQKIQEITPSITVKEQFESTKFLGIYFNEDLKNASQINWDNTIEKMEKHKHFITQITIPIWKNNLNKHTPTLKSIPPE